MPESSRKMIFFFRIRRNSLDNSVRELIFTSENQPEYNKGDPLPMTDWEEVIKRGVESDVLDYKAAQNWNELNRVGRAKFARHCMALANTKGGFVVVGVGEDPSGKPSELTGLTEKEALSFDPTAVGNFVNRYADPQIEFTLERPVVEGKQFIVFAVKPFSQMPHICTGGCDCELLQGVFYIRTADASSRPAYRASEVHGLIQRAMRNQRAMLGRMIRGLLYESGSFRDPGAEEASRFAEELRHSREFFRKRIPGPAGSLQLELTLSPAGYEEERFSLSDLQESVLASEQSVREKTLFMTPEMVRDSYLTNASLRFAGENRGFQLYRSGLFHYSAREKSPEALLSYEMLCDFIAQGVAFCGKLCEQLGFSTESLILDLTLDHVEKRTLCVPFGTASANTVCHIPAIRIRRSLSGTDLQTHPGQEAYSLICSVCERFQVSRKEHSSLHCRLQTFFPEQEWGSGGQ